MHAQSMLVADHGLTLMAADTPNSMKYTPGDTFGRCIDQFGVSWLA